MGLNIVVVNLILSNICLVFPLNVEVGKGRTGELRILYAAQLHKSEIIRAVKFFQDFICDSLTSWFDCSRLRGKPPPVGHFCIFIFIPNMFSDN